MAKQVEEIIVGIDTAQQWLDLYRADTQASERIDNTVEAVKAWLKGFSTPLAIAIEATNCYHEVLVEAAIAAGHVVYLIDPRKLHHYREATGGRAKTDRQDAILLARYLQRERSELRPFQPASPQQQRLWRLLKRRAALVQARTQLAQSLADVQTTLKRSVDALLRQMNNLITLMERQLMRMMAEQGWRAMFKHCKSVPGIGPLTALALTTLYHRGHFENADQFVAFLGLDVRVRDSGRYRERRKLTKRGDPEARRLLHNAAMAAARNPLFKARYEALLARGLSTTAAYVVIARKLARIAFALMRNGANFDPQTSQWGLLGNIGSPTGCYGVARAALVFCKSPTSDSSIFSGKCT